jgi:hypothetical protein
MHRNRGASVPARFMPTARRGYRVIDTRGRWLPGHAGPILRGGMSRFVVDHRSLLQLRDTLGRLHGQLLGVPTVVSGFDGVLGGRALESELARFCNRWHYGIVLIAGRIEGMMGRLSAAADAYGRIEQRVAGSGHRKLSGSGTTTIGGPPESGSGTTTIG